MLTRMAQESGVETPTAEDLARFDRKRKGKTLSNADWKSPTDPDARIARMKDGTTHLAYKPEHAVDLDTGVVVAAPIHAADQGDTTTLSPTLEVAARNLEAVGLAPSEAEPCVVVADKGYHAREQLKTLDGGVWKTRIAEPEPAKGYLRWHGDEAAQRAVYANRARLKSGIGRQTMRRRGEMVERSFAHILERGGMRRAWLRGRENVHKRYLIHVAGFNLGVLMRARFGQGTPREAAEALYGLIFVLQTDAALAFALIAAAGGELAAIVIVVADPTRNGKTRTSSTGCFATPLVLPLLVLCLTKLTQTFPPILRYVAVGGLIVLAIPSLNAFLSIWRQALEATVVWTPRGRAAFLEEPTLPELLRRIAATPPADGYFFYPYIPMMPFLTARHDVTPYDIYVPNYTTPSQYQDACMAVMQHASWIVIDRFQADPKFWAFGFPAMRDTRPPEVSKFEQALESAFERVAQDGPFELLRRRPAGADPGRCSDIAR